MMKRIAVCLTALVVFASSLPGYAADKLTDNADLSSYIEKCEQFGTYEELAEALLCAACISYGESPEQCVTELQEKGFTFESAISTELSYNADLFDVAYDADGTARTPMMQEVALIFSSQVTLYLRTEDQMIAVEPANDVAGIQDADIWMPVEDVTDGNIIAAHLQFFDEDAQEWITWNFMSPDDYKEG